MADTSLHLEDKLGVVAICSTQQPHALDRLERKRRQLPRADEPYLPNATAIGEGETLAVRVELPSRLLVLD